MGERVTVWVADEEGLWRIFLESVCSGKHTNFTQIVFIQCDLKRELMECHSCPSVCSLSTSLKIIYWFFTLDRFFDCFCFVRGMEEKKNKWTVIESYWLLCLLTPQILCALSVNHTYLAIIILLLHAWEVKLEQNFTGLSILIFFCSNFCCCCFCCSLL